MTMHFPPPPPLPKKAVLFRQVPPAVFPPILGLFGLGLAWRRGAAGFGVPQAVVEMVLGAVSLLFVFALVAYGVKLALRPAVCREDLRVLPGRTGIAAMTMGAMALAAVLVPYAPGLAKAVLGTAVLAHLAVAGLVLWSLVRHPGETGPATPALHLVFVGFIVAPAAAVPLGLAGGALTAGIVYCLSASLLITARTAAPFLTRREAPPLRPLHAIHLAPAALVSSAAFMTGAETLALVTLAWATLLFVVLLMSAQWMTEAGFTGFWSAFTFPLAAYAGTWFFAYGAFGWEAARIAGGIVLVLATMIIPPIALKVMQMWAKGTLAAKTNAAIA